MCAIAWTLQPLWPESTRVTISYVAVGAAGLVGILMAMIIGMFYNREANLTGK